MKGKKLIIGLVVGLVFVGWVGGGWRRGKKARNKKQEYPVYPGKKEVKTKEKYALDEVLIKVNKALIKQTGKGIVIKDKTSWGLIDRGQMPRGLVKISYQYPIKEIEWLMGGDGIKSITRLKGLRNKRKKRGVIYKIKFKGVVPVKRIVKELSKDPEIIYAEPNFLVHTTQPRVKSKDFDKAVKFQDKSGGIYQMSLKNQPINTAPLTIEVWVKIITNGSMPVFYKEGIYETTEGKRVYSGLYYLTVGNSGVTFVQNDMERGVQRRVTVGFNFEKGRWYHVAGVADENEVRIYINGVLMGKKAKDKTRFRFVENRFYKIGGLSYGGTAIPMVIDELRVSAAAINVVKRWQEGFYFHPLPVEETTRLLFHFDNLTPDGFVEESASGAFGERGMGVEFITSDVPTDFSGVVPIPVSPTPSPIKAVVNDPYFLDPHPKAKERDWPTNQWGWDPEFDYQWDMKVIQINRVWEKNLPDVPIKIAVIDTGVDYNHTEFKGVNVIKGKDFVNDDDDPMDDHGHGTHVAGIIAAKQNNNLGIAGINDKVEIIAYKVLSADGWGSVDDIIRAIRDATEKGAKVINLSLGGRFSSYALNEVLEQAYKNRVVVVAAAGNEGSLVKFFAPANSPYTLTVGATDPDDKKAFYSNYGEILDVTAPGGTEEKEVLSLTAFDQKRNTFMYKGVPVGNQGFMRLIGTSMAAPHVTGVVSWVELAFYQTYKRWPTSEEVFNIIRNGVDDLGEKGFDPYYGYGRINADKAVTKLNINEPLRVRIDFPRDSEMLGISKYAIKGLVQGKGVSYEIEWKWENEGVDKFKKTGISLNPQREKGKVSVLGWWDLSQTEEGKKIKPIDLRLKAKDEEGNHIEKWVKVRINPYLVKGFPSDKIDIQSDKRLISGDIDNDGKEELIGTGKKKFYVINKKGEVTEVIDRVIGGKDTESGEIVLDSEPSVGEINRERVGKEVAGTVYTQWDRGIIKYGVAVWDGEGNLLPGWPQMIKGKLDYRKSPVLVDIDNDGEKEVLFTSGSKSFREGKIYLQVWDRGGQEIMTIDLPTREEKPFAEVEKVLAADINGNGQKEIIVWLQESDMSAPYGEDKVLIYDAKGKLVIESKEEWRNYGGGDMMVGDVDKDGKKEIIYHHPFDRRIDMAGIYYKSWLHVLGADLKDIKGWPVKIDGTIDKMIMTRLKVDDQKARILALEGNVTAYEMNRQWVFYNFKGEKKERMIVDGKVPFIDDGGWGYDVVSGDIDGDGKMEFVGIEEKENRKYYLVMIEHQGGDKFKEEKSWPYARRYGDKLSITNLEGDFYHELITGGIVWGFKWWGKQIEWPGPEGAGSNTHNKIYEYPKVWKADDYDVNLNNVSADRGDVICFIAKYLENNGYGVTLDPNGAFIYDPAGHDRVFNRNDVVKTIIKYLPKPLVGKKKGCLDLPRKEE